MSVRNLLVVSLMLVTGMAHAFDHTHGDWERLLQRHVVLSADGKASQVDYAGFQAERGDLDAYLAQLSAVRNKDFSRWSQEQRLAFLINAYNAFTVQLILSRYPDIASIRDLGGFLRSPWKRRFFTLLGASRHLDELEHELIRAPGVYDEPRIHFAVNCASIGCPMLRHEAYVAERLDAQLNDAMRRFLTDRSRNRFESEQGLLRVSKIFDWYEEDFIDPARITTSIEQYLQHQARLLADSPEALTRLKKGDFRIRFLDYDWRLNDIVSAGELEIRALSD